MPLGLLEPRLYRAAFAPALLALIVLAFSLEDPQRAFAPELAPPTFSAQRAIAAGRQLVDQYGARESGSRQDADVAGLVAGRLKAAGFDAARYRFDAKTLNGKRELINVLGMRAGPSDRRLVIVTSRDGSPGVLDRAGAVETGVLLELARVLQGRSFDHTIVLASVSGSADGGLGADELARRLRRPVDAVIVLRNLTAEPADPAIVAQNDSRLRPDPRFERTMNQIALRELGRRPAEHSTIGQLVRIGYPVALGEQATYAARRLSAVSVSPGGEPLGAAGFSRVSQVAAAGTTALRSLTTFDGDYRPSPPSPEQLGIGGKLVPGWAIILFIGSLLLPLVVIAVDGWARARRWDESSTRGLLAPPLAMLWLAIVALALRAIGWVGLIDAPSLPAEPAAIDSTGALVVGSGLIALALFGVLVAAAGTRQITPKGGEAGFALWIAAAALGLFSLNPIAAGFWLLLAHLLVIMLLAGTRPRRLQIWGLTLAGAVPVAVAMIYYPLAFDLGLTGSVRFAVLLQAGGFVGLFATAAICALTAAILTALLHLHWTAPVPRTPTKTRSPLL
ncbi:MAG: hypothetical protein WAP37_02140 [Solirubrobacterales bacterium]